MRVGKEARHDQAQEVEHDGVEDKLHQEGDEADHDGPDLVLRGTVDSKDGTDHANHHHGDNARHDAVRRALHLVHLRHGLDGLVADLVVLDVLVEIGIGVGEVDRVHGGGAADEDEGEWDGEYERHDVDPDDGRAHVAAATAAVGRPGPPLGDDGRGYDGSCSILHAHGSSLFRSLGPKK